MTPFHCETKDRGLVHRAVFLSLVLTAPTDGGMARLSWPWWLGLHIDLVYPSANGQSPIQVLTGPGVDQLRWCDHDVCVVAGWCCEADSTLGWELVRSARRCTSGNCSAHLRRDDSRAWNTAHDAHVFTSTHTRTRY